MKLSSIQLQNYRRFEDLKVEFHSGFNVIAGVNGSGKTSLLKAICDALTGFTNYLNYSSATFTPLAEQDVPRLGRFASGDRYRFEQLYPVKVSASGTVFGQRAAWSVTKASQATAPIWAGPPPGELLRSEEALRQSLSADKSSSVRDLTLPLLAFYRAYRNWIPAATNEMAAATERNSRGHGYKFWWDAASESSGLQQWAVSKSMERLQFVAERSIKWDAVRDDELAQVNQALEAIVEGARGLRYDFAKKQLLIDWVDESEPTAFQNLSDGQRVAIALAADIARRMCLINPHLGETVIKSTPGIVLIDELDIHLHPKWQRLITKGLKTAFPELQIIATSHSPQILSELSPQEIILLEAEGVSHPRVSYGLDSSKVLEQIMSVQPRPAEVEEQLSKLFEALERGNLEAARGILASLKVIAPGIPELVGAEALLARKEVLGR